MSDEPRNPFWVNCKPCGHSWPIAYLPMDVSVVAKLMRHPVCPNCGASGKEIVIANQEDGKLLEPASNG